MELAARNGELAKMERALDAGRDVNTIVDTTVCICASAGFRIPKSRSKSGNNMFCFGGSYCYFLSLD